MPRMPDASSAPAGFMACWPDKLEARPDEPQKPDMAHYRQPRADRAVRDRADAGIVQFIHGLNISPNAMPGQVMFHIAMLALGAIVFVAGMWGPSL